MPEGSAGGAGEDADVTFERPVGAEGVGVEFFAGEADAVGEGNFVIEHDAVEAFEGGALPDKFIDEFEQSVVTLFAAVPVDLIGAGGGQVPGLDGDFGSFLVKAVHFGGDVGTGGDGGGAVDGFADADAAVGFLERDRIEIGVHPDRVAGAPEIGVALHEGDEFVDVGEVFGEQFERVDGEDVLGFFVAKDGG